MSNLTAHPENVQLLEYLDGELPRRQARKMQRHLEACWQCRAELEELQATVNDCVRYRKQVLVPGMPAPPKVWADLNFARVDAELAADSIFSRLVRSFSPRGYALRWALSGALALALAAVAIRQLRETPNVQAASLLQKAIAAIDTRPATVRRLRITTSNSHLTRVIGAARPVAGEAPVATLFASARYDWNDPLSAKAFAAWRDALQEKVDEVASSDPNSYTIKTSTTTNELLSATLSLRKTDLEPIAGRFEFRNHEWVEMTELVDQLISPSGTVAGTLGGAPRQPGAPPDSSLPRPTADKVAAEAAPVSEELQVFAALHQVGADLGDPIELGRDGRDIVVSGIGIAPRRQQEIHSVLDRLPHVAVRFTDPALPASTPVHGEPAPARDAASPERSKHAAQLEQRLGGRPQFERFSGQVLDWTDAALSRAYALRRLAQQFPVATENAMRDDDRRTLHNISNEHLAALRKDLDKLRVTLEPIMGTVPTNAQAASTTDWQPASEALLDTARRMESQLAQVLGVTSAAPVSDAPAQLLASISQLTSDIEHCQRLLSYDKR